MDLESLQPLFEWIKANPTWAGLMVFLIAMSESLLVVGLIVPGAMMMFGVGALVGTHVLGFWETILWAFVGAIVGDGVSFWIGYFFSDRVENVWPFKKKPETLKKAQDFFIKHGGKSILFGRFVGPVRPIIPAVAGMMKMSPWKFTFINVISAVGWAPAYLFPGIVFGTSLGLASQVTTRLALLILVGLVGIWLIYLIIKRGVVFIGPRAEEWLKNAYTWSLQHPHIGRLSRQILDPNYSPTAALAWWAVLLVALFSISAFFLSRLIGTAQGVLSDDAVFHFLQDLRFSTLDDALVFVFQLGDFLVLTTVVAVMILWSWKQSNRRILLYWSIAYSVAMLSLVLINSGLNVPRPFDFTGPSFNINFPSWHSTMPIVTYGFFAVLISEGLGPNLRWLLYSGAAVLSLAISFAGLTLGAHWASDVVIGYCFGLSWLVLVAMALRRRPHVQPNKIKLSILFIASLVLIQSVNVVSNFSKDIRKFSYESSVHSISPTEWFSQEWKNVAPPFRYSLWGRKKQAMTFQWAAYGQSMREFLLEQGWGEVEPIGIANSIKFFAPDLPLDEIPVLPNLNNGNEEYLIMKKAVKEDEEWVLRLWPSDFKLPDNRQIFVGNITLHTKSTNGLLALRKVSPKTLDVVAIIPQIKSIATIKQVRYELHGEEMQSGWDGRVLLIESF